MAPCRIRSPDTEAFFLRLELRNIPDSTPPVLAILYTRHVLSVPKTARLCMGLSPHIPIHIPAYSPKHLYPYYFL